MVFSCVVIGMRMDERSAQSNALHGQREREGEDLPHVATLFVTSPRGVKGGRYLRV
jgi:hypothetical protein